MSYCKEPLVAIKRSSIDLFWVDKNFCNTEALFKRPINGFLNSLGDMNIMGVVGTTESGWERGSTVEPEDFSFASSSGGDIRPRAREEEEDEAAAAAAAAVPPAEAPEAVLDDAADEGLGEEEESAPVLHNLRVKRELTWLAVLSKCPHRMISSHLFPNLLYPWMHRN